MVSTLGKDANIHAKGAKTVLAPFLLIVRMFVFCLTAEHIAVKGYGE